MNNNDENKISKVEYFELREKRLKLVYKILYVVVPCYNEEEVLKVTTEKLTEKLNKMVKDKLIDKMHLYDIILKLTEKEKRIITLRYFRDKTQSEIASTLGVSQVQISRIENKILQNFKEMFR